ncbi:MAG: class II aldolase/adducin family protein [Candidatus Melainabacteria bacterium]|nr:class II aldolase/adducin family protein [Candidatus Melainabacteria bacterium]
MNSIETEMADLIEISRFAGERFDLVQAGGGNTSVKLDDGRIFVKASGMALSEVSSESDFCLLEWPSLVQFLSSCATNATTEILEAQAKIAVAAALSTESSSKRRPSIETLLHCLLGKYTLHTHPIAVASLVCRSDWQKIVADIFATTFPQYQDALFMVPYRTPGPALAVALLQQLKEKNWQSAKPDKASIAIVFLENHGLIVAGASKQVVMQITNEVVDKLASRLTFNLYRYKLVNFASALVNQVCGTKWLAYLSDDHILLDALRRDPAYLLASCATPDQLVYCGARGMALTEFDSPEAVQSVADYLEQFGHPPKVIISGEHVLLLGQSLRKCRETEEVLRSHVMLQLGGELATMNYLNQGEVDYLSDWEAEKYRQTL